ncbi:MAG: SDR family oxidoreductase [Vicinamibacteria bacterium]|nr:SDR family oxidoreductase [Vicinamibacteria bacterium]
MVNLDRFPFRQTLLENRTLLITGGGTGLGRSMAIKCASLGAKVAVVGRREEPLKITVKEIEKVGGAGACAQCDVRDVTSVKAAFDSIEASLGPVNALINNAAGNFLCASEDLSDNAFDSVVKIVLYGSFNCTREIGRRLIKREAEGNILSIVTSYASTGSAFVLPSAAAKAGVLAMMRSLAVEWATYGIRLNAVAPGPFKTEGAFSRLMVGELEKQALRRVPSKRFGDHDELTNLIAYLLSDASPYQTGDCVTIDGAEGLFSGQQFSGFAHIDRASAKEMMSAVKPKK